MLNKLLSKKSSSHLACDVPQKVILFNYPRPFTGSFIPDYNTVIGLQNSHNQTNILSFSNRSIFFIHETADFNILAFFNSQFSHPLHNHTHTDNALPFTANSDKSVLSII